MNLADMIQDMVKKNSTVELRSRKASEDKSKAQLRNDDIESKSMILESKLKENKKKEKKEKKEKKKEKK
jgi:hypothetical protein